ncbi:hypothetical protein D3C71_1752740 [compost metagenome]
MEVPASAADAAPLSPAAADEASAVALPSAVVVPSAVVLPSVPSVLPISVAAVLSLEADCPADAEESFTEAAS